MEGFLQGLGIFALAVIAVIGLLAGWIAGQIAGRNKALYVLLGVVGALATPFVLAALGIGALAAGGIVLIALVAAAGAVAVLIVGKLIFDRRR
jgi:uncharacterized membrane protein YeaQ/YmgE (transglycosylase-associated protein family)